MTCNSIISGYGPYYKRLETRTSVLILLFVALWFILRGDFLCLTLCHFVLVYFSPFSITIPSLRLGKRANISAFRTFVRFVFGCICRFPLSLGVWEGLLFVIVALPGFLSYLFCFKLNKAKCKIGLS